MSESRIIEPRPALVRPTGLPGERRGIRGAIAYGRWWWMLPGLILAFLIHYVATAVGAFFAFTDYSGIGSFDVIGLDNFAEIFQDPVVLGAIGNTLFLAFAQLVGSNIVGLLLALGLNRLVKSRYILRTVFFLPTVLSPLAVSYVWRYIFEFNGPLNQVLGALGREDLQRVWLADPEASIWTIVVVIVWQNIGITMVIYLAGLATVAPELEEAAALDGAGRWKRFRFVVLPSVQPSVAIATMLMLIQGLRIFDPIIAMTGGGPAGATENLATQVYLESFARANFGYGAALALVLTVGILIFAALQQHLVRDRSAR